MADSIGKSIQTIAGVTQNGFSSTGFYVGFLLLIILVVGLYVAYTGLIKRETSKALHAVINFVVVFVLSASFIAYAPDYIKKINEFSSDISTASLDLGTKIMLPNSDSKGKDSVDLIRDSLFSIQVEQPWLLLQFGNGTNILLVIEDNGCGIKASDLSRVFEKGFTGSNRNKANATGMGLYLSKKLCDRLGLKLDIASTEKEYTRLTITFPKGTVHNFSE